MDDRSDNEDMEGPDFALFSANAQKSVDYVTEQFNNMHVGKASRKMLDKVCKSVLFFLIIIYIHPLTPSIFEKCYI